METPDYEAPIESRGLLLGLDCDLALHFAFALHRPQARKRTTIPYIAHLLSACALVLENGGDEDQAIAALLHDAVEDQGGLPTLVMIERLFRPRVAAIVRECSDSESPSSDHKLPWHRRKHAYLDHVQQASPDALLIAAAELHNPRDIRACYREMGDEL